MFKLDKDALRKGLLHIGALLAMWCFYALLIEHFGGFTTVHLYRQWLEILVVLYLYGYLYIMLKPARGRALLAAVPLLLIYLVHDVFFLAYGKVFRFVNLNELPELLQILPATHAVLLILLFVVPALLILRTIDYRRPLPIIAGLLPVAITVFVIEATPAAFATGFQSVSSEIVKYSDVKSVENNGRLAMFLYREAQRLDMLDRIAPYRGRARYEAHIAERVAQLRANLKPRNVHLIVLESFLDPRLFKDLKFSQSPVHPNFERLFGNTLGLSISPVFGGATAQAEFEVLCGVPAFEKLSSVEFNAFTGAPAHCLPGILSSLDYRTVASNAYKPDFFNAQPAYRGIGFAEQQFPTEFYGAQATYLRFGDPGVEEYLFDRDLFAQNLAFVRNHMEQHPGTPLFNYLMTIYGHTPHLLDPAERPETIKVISHYADDHLQRATNQFYYRTQAVAAYVNELIALDKDSLTILISDHVPPLRNGANTYNALRYMGNEEQSYYYNRIAIVEDGKPVKYPPLHHYDLPDVIANYLTEGRYCKAQQCDYMRRESKPREASLDRYLALMAHASE